MHINEGQRADSGTEVSGGINPLLAVREAATILHISIPTFWRRVADGTVPKPVKLGSLSRWPKSEILSVIEDAKAARGVTKFQGGAL